MEEGSGGLRIGLVANNPNFPGAWQETVEKIVLADELGYDAVWLGETWGYDIVSRLTELVLVTKRIKIGAGIFNVFSRTPGTIASTIATLDERSGGRILCGLGSSGAQVIEHWHGVPFDRPLRRLREYTEIINLIMRLYDPLSGSITIDDTDLRDVTFQSIRDRIAFVGQDTFLFHGTVRHNIELGRQGATSDEIIAAATAANAHEFIMNLPNGYNTDVGENGSRLSGGQKQRLAIARAMLRNAQILILDEATSALDSESESLIRDALSNLTAGRTTIMIAHRLSSVTAAHHIVVMEGGRAVETGTSQQLLAQEGAFRRLYELQLLPNYVT